MHPDPSAPVDVTVETDRGGRHAVSFPVARRGYDPHRVDHVVEGLAGEIEGLRATVAELREREADLLAALDAAEYRGQRAEQQVQALTAELAVARGELARMTSPAPADPGPAPDPDSPPEPPAGDPDVAAMVGAETARIVEAARHAAVEIGARAREDAERIEAEAREEARRIRADAEVQLLNRTREADDAVAARLLEAADAVQQAEERAAAIVADAFTEAATVVLRAREEAAEIAATAEQHGEELLAAAREARDELLGDLVRRRKTLRRQVEQLEAGRARLRSAYEVVEVALADATAELDRTPDEARAAARAAAEQADTADDPELTAALRRLDAGSEPTPAGEEPTAAADEPAPATDGPPPGTDAASAPDHPAPVAEVAPSGTASPAVEDAADEAPGAEGPAGTAEPAADGAGTDEPGAGDPGAHPAARAQATGVGPADGSGEEPADATRSAPGGAEPTTVDGTAAEPATVDGTATEPAAADAIAAGRPAADPAGDAAAGTPSGRRRRRRAPDPVEFEGRWSSAVRVLPPGDATTRSEPARPARSRRGRGAPSASEVFARLRADGPHQPSLFEGTGSDSPAADSTAVSADAPHGPVPSPPTAPLAGPGSPAGEATAGGASADLESAWVEQRDAAAAPALRALRRRLKATLADDEDALLEAIRRCDPIPVAVDSLRDARARRDDLAIALGASLQAAATAGGELARRAEAHRADEAPAPVDAATIDAVAVELADLVVEPLDERLERAFARYHRSIGDGGTDDPDAALAALVSSVKAAYRARRGVQVQVPTEDAVLRAVHLGVARALDPGTPLRWIVVPPAAPPKRSAASGAAAQEPGPARTCPTCVAVADVGAGDAFGHGHELPPARSGCRCAVAPVAAVVPRPG